MSPSASVTMFTPAKVRRLKRPAVSSWSRLKRSSDSASTTSNRRFSASRISAWNPARSSVAPETAWSVYSSQIVQPCRSRELAADAQLIRDRGVALVVRRVARVDGDFHHWFPSLNRIAIAASAPLEALACGLTRQSANERRSDASVGPEPSLPRNARCRARSNCRRSTRARRLSAMIRLPNSKIDRDLHMRGLVPAGSTACGS